MKFPDITSTKVIIPTVLFAILTPAVTGVTGLENRVGMAALYGILHMAITRVFARFVVTPTEVYLATAMYFLLGSGTTSMEGMIQMTFVFWIAFALIRSQSPLDF
jgi:hypothetical protein